MAKRKRKGGANPPTGEGDSPPVSAAFFGAIDEFEDADVFDVYALLCAAERERRTAVALAPHAEQDTLGQRARSDHAWRLAAKLPRRGMRRPVGQPTTQPSPTPRSSCASAER